MLLKVKNLQMDENLEEYDDDEINDDEYKICWFYVVYESDIIENGFTIIQHYS